MKQQSNKQPTMAQRGAGALTAVRAALGVDSFRFGDKVVVITGGSRGLGLVMARRLAREGARLALIARDEDELSRARVDLESRGAQVMTVRCDVRDNGDVEQAVEAILAQLGGIDVLINNAGVIQVGPMEVMTPEDYEEAMRTHFWGPLQMTMAVLPAMRSQGHGRIVNISSIGGRIAVPHLLPYSASKFALVGLSEGMRSELLRHGIVVTTVTPGLMRTGSPVNAFFKGKHREEYTWFTVMDSLPVISISAERAARIILRAVRRGRAQVTFTPLARLGARLHGAMPGLTDNLMALMNAVLPSPNGIGTQRAKGRDSETSLTRSFLTWLTRRAAQKNNQMP